MSSIQVHTKLSAEDRQAIVSETVAALRPLLESKPELVDSRAMAAQLSISPATLDRLTRTGQIPSIKIGSSRRYKPDAVIEALEKEGGGHEA